MLPAGPAQAQTQWTGAASTDWFTAGNWNPAAVPGTGTSVQINTTAPNATFVGAAGAIANQLTLGNNVGQSGNLTVGGATSTLTLSNAVGLFLVGNFGSGDVTVSGGGVLTTRSTAIGNQTGSTGMVTVTGAGSRWDLIQPVFAFHVGSSGTGTLNVLAGGRVTSTVFGMDLGVDLGAVGNVLVSGTNSALTVPSTTNIGSAAGGTGTMQASDNGLLALATVTVGAAGQGTLTVDTAADLTATQLTIGSSAQGQATFNGAGTTAAMTGAVRVGLNAGGAGTLTIENGATMTSLSSLIAQQTGSTGNVTITGSGSRWTINEASFASSSLSIGQAGASTGSGTLSVRNGGELIMGSANSSGRFQGFNSATVTIDGANSRMTLNPANSGLFSLGSSGATNRLDVTNGGAISSGPMNFSTVAGSGVAVNVSGAGSSLTATGRLNTPGVILGGAGTSTMTVNNSATVNVTGDFTVDGSAATSLTISNGAQVTQNAGSDPGFSGQFRLGVDGNATLRIESGGSLTTLNHPTFAGFTFFGRNAGSTAAATITGAGSTWASHGSVIIGSAGTAIMDILAGGTVTGERGADIGFLAGSNGSVLVSGANSAWLLSEPPPLAGISNISVGIGGTGALRIEDGARVAAQGVGVGSAQDTNTPGTGTLVVTGTGTRLDLNVGSFQTFGAGDDGGTGTIDVLAGAVVTVVGQGHFGRSSVFTGQVPTQALGNGTLTVDGTGSRVTFTQTLDIGEQATGVLNVQNGGFVSNSDGYLGSFTNALGSAGVGTATVTGAGSAWQNSGFLRVGDQGTGTLNVLAGGVVTNTNAIMANAAGTTGTATVDGAGSAWTGTGTLAVGNLGTATLNIRNSGTVTAPGGVSINNLSTLNIGSGGAAGTLNAPTVANAGLVRFNHTGATTFAAAISGAGTVTKDAAGTTTLTGDSTYTGITTINAGTLQLGAGGTTGGITGNITNNAALIINRSNAFNYGGSIGGTGTLTHNGTGTTTLGGVSGYNGATTINAGTLNVNGSITNSTVTVNAAGTLGGIGTVGPTTVAGNIAPGNSIGTLNVAGPYVQVTGSTYTVELNTTTTDLINVTGTATIQAGTTVSVLPAPGFYTLGQRYTILTASAGVTGQYTTLTDNAPFVDFELDSDANNIFLDVIRSSVSFQEVAQTRNQRASASGVEALGPGNVIFDSVVMLDAVNARRAFDLLSGEIHASIAGTMLEDSRFIRNAVTGRLQSIGGTAAIFAPRLAALNFAEGGADADTASLMFDNDALAYAPQKRKRVRDTMDRALPVRARPSTTGRVFAAWGQAFGSWGSADGDGNAAALSRNTGGFLTGLDVTFAGSRGDVWRAGLAGGYQYTSVNVGDRNSSGRIDTYHLAAYGGRQIGPLGLRAGASYGWHDISTNRSIVFPGFSDTTKAKYDAGTAQVFGEIGYALTHRQFALEPFAGLAYVSIRATSFAEAGGAAALNGSGGTSDTTYSTLGLRAASPLPWRDLSGLTAKASAAWRHAFGTVTPTAQLGFASGTTPFVVAGTPIARDAAALELGLEGTVARGATLGVAYSGQVAGHADDHGITANYVQRF